MDVQDLFRREVLDARRTSQLGNVVLVPPRYARYLTLAACVVVLAAVLLLVLGTYTHRSRVTGSLVPRLGLVTVRAPIAGVVSDVYAPEGRHVGAREPLALVRVPGATVGVADTTSAIQRQLQQRRNVLASAQAAQRQQLAAQTTGLRRQIANSNDELARLNDEVATKRSQVAIAREALEKFRALAAQGYVSALQVEQHNSEVLDYTSQLQALQREIVQARRAKTQAEQDLQELSGLRLLKQAESDNELARLEQERLETKARHSLIVDAPVRGVVAVQLAKPGQSVESGQPLFVVLPGLGDLEAELMVPSRAIGFVAPGDRVLLRYDAFPYQKFGHQEGTVVRISRSTLEGDAREADGNGAHEPLYRVSVALARQAVAAYGRQEPLKPGMVLQADILGERRRLIEWVLEPLYSLGRN